MIYYDEQVFLDLTAKYQIAVNQIKALKSEEFKYKLKAAMDIHSNEFHQLKEIGEKIYEFTIKLFKWNIFNKHFNDFREEMQTYFFEEFDQIVDIYY